MHVAAVVPEPKHLPARNDARQLQKKGGGGPHGVQDMLSDACVHASLHHLVLNERDHQRDFQVHLDVLVDHFCVVAFTVLELDVRKMRRVQHGDRTRVLHLTRF